MGQIKNLRVERFIERQRKRDMERAAILVALYDGTEMSSEEFMLKIFEALQKVRTE